MVKAHLANIQRITEKTHTIIMVAVNFRNQTCVHRGNVDCPTEITPPENSHRLTSMNVILYVGYIIIMHTIIHIIS